MSDNQNREPEANPETQVQHDAPETAFSKDPHQGDPRSGDLHNGEAFAQQESGADGAPGDAEDAAQTEARRLLEMRPEEKQPYWTPARRKNLREWVVSLLIAVVAVFIVRVFLFTVIRVDGPSMQDTLINGDRLIVTILDMKIAGPQRGDIVICHFPGDEPQGNILQKTWGNFFRDRYVKRVIGMPGETIEIRDGVTYIDGEAQTEDYVTYPPRGDYGPETVPEGHYLVMGDNRGNSHDSRYDDVGPLSRDMMLGKVRLIMWPFNHAGVVK